MFPQGCLNRFDFSMGTIDKLGAKSRPDGVEIDNVIVFATNPDIVFFVAVLCVFRFVAHEGSTIQVDTRLVNETRLALTANMHFATA